jgi:predicted RNA binding protein YcfA (HicA-like mRNA interferase family)
MSPKLPVVSGARLIKAFGKIGYYIRSQQGSHVHLRHPIHPPLTIPNHREIARGTLRADKMVINGMGDADIHKITGMPLEKIRQVRKKLRKK